MNHGFAIIVDVCTNWKIRKSHSLVIIVLVSLLLIHFFYSFNAIVPISKASTDHEMHVEASVEGGVFIDFNQSTFIFFDESPALQVINYNGVDDLHQMFVDYFSRGKLLCPVEELRRNTSIPDLPVAVMISFNCEELFNAPPLGTATYIHIFNLLRVAALIDGNITLCIQCDDANDRKLELIYPWLMGCFPPPVDTNSFATYGLISKPLSCNATRHTVAHGYDLIQYDLRRMAIALLGHDHIRSQAEELFWGKQPHNSLGTIYTLPTPKKDDIPLLVESNITLDDAVIHFRCGDLMESTHPFYFFMSFYDYTRYISPDVRSIGILTQSFKHANNRKSDAKQILFDRCRVVVLSFVEYIQEKFPGARISIHNNENETTALAYARMIMANQTIVGLSSFSAFAALAAFGTSYVPIPKVHHPNGVLKRKPYNLLPNNVVLFHDAKLIRVGDMKSLWDATNGTEQVLHWFWNGDNNTIYR